MNSIDQLRQQQTRRAVLEGSTLGLGAMALSQLSAPASAAEKPRHPNGGLQGLPHSPPRVRRVIYLFQSGGPAQMDLFDYKPGLHRRFGEEVPTSIYPDERKTTMTSGQSSFPVAPSALRFRQYGDSGTWLSEPQKHLSEVVDDICVIRSMYTEAINHDPAATLFQTGSVIAGRPSMGAWVSYGLGSENANLPAFVALTSNGTGKQGQPLYDRLWGAGFLPGRFQGVKFRGQGDPILDLYNPQGMTREQRRRTLNSLQKLNAQQAGRFNDPAIATRIAQYELAFRMQMSVPELIDVQSEPKNVLDMYGPEATQVGKYAYNCLLARRLAERGVRFIQLYHRGWDAHGNAPRGVASQCRDTDQPTAALLKDLKQRGMLEDTLVVWGGEFGRTIYCQGKLTRTNYGRDHHPNCFTYWMAGGGVRGGMTYGATDEYSVNVVENPVHVHDLQATILHQLGINHERLTYRFQGRHYRLTDVHGNVVNDVLS
ncbi:MAG TPA: sulfatase [Planctomycetaceae bacterium]|nr:sulfatase [Planctomycetaceae bacterium]